MLYNQLLSFPITPEEAEFAKSDDLRAILRQLKAIDPLVTQGLVAEWLCITPGYLQQMLTAGTLAHHRADAFYCMLVAYSNKDEALLRRFIAWWKTKAERAAKAQTRQAELRKLKYEVAPVFATPPPPLAYQPKARWLEGLNLSGAGTLEVMKRVREYKSAHGVAPSDQELRSMAEIVATAENASGRE